MNGEETAKARVSSPRYPLHDLGHCVEAVQKVYVRDRLNVTSRDAVAKHLGYKGDNGASKRVTASMLQFGLLDDAGRGYVKVSDIAHGILKPDSPSEKAHLLREALRRPKIFAALLNEYGEGLASDINIQHRLERAHSYTEDAAKAVIRSIRSSIECVRSAETVDGGDEVQDGSDEKFPATKGQGGRDVAQGHVTPAEQPNAHYRSIEANLSATCIAEVRITGSIHRAEHARLGKWLSSVVPGWAEFLTLDDEEEDEPIDVASDEVGA